MFNTTIQGKNRFFQRTHHPYYIVAPAFRQTSAGIRALHYLCHMLNESGYEAYVTTPADQSSPYLRTPQITPEIRRQHDASGVAPIAVYPEVVSGNPLGLPVVARWTLNKPGHLGGDCHYPETDLIFHYRGVILDGIASDRLDMPLVDRRIFHKGEEHRERRGFCYYAGKYLAFQHKISTNVLTNPDATSLALNIPRTHQEIAEILRTSKVFYTYEPSTIIYEALACGCAVAYIENPYLEQFVNLLDAAQIIIPRIKESEIGSVNVPMIPETEIEKFLEETESNAKADIENFIQKTQEKARDYVAQCIAEGRPIQKLSETLETNQTTPFTDKDHAKHYQNWLSLRETSSQKWMIASQEGIHTDSPHFHIISQPASSEMASFADTLDSIAAQIHPEWLLEVFSEIPAPEGLDEIPCIRWHAQCQRPTDTTIIERVQETDSQWIIHLPTGVILDPLYLWRLAESIKKNPDSQAYFVDDDCYSANGDRSNPRFKPGCNPAALLSANLAGVLCVKREAWLALAAADIPNTNSFAQLLGITEKFGWHSIQHIPDILLSYPENFQSDGAQCQTHLREHLKAQGINAEIIQTGPISWCIRYPLIDEPQVTVAIISEGIFELLSRCLEKLCSLTQYKNYEILVDLESEDAIPDILNLLKEQQEKYGISIHANLSPTDTTYANRCNAAVDRIKNDFIVMLAEEAQVIQETWLGELVRTATEETIAAVMPRLIQPGSAKIENIGHVLGLGSGRGLPYRGIATIGDAGYLDYIQMQRDISLLPRSCYLIKKRSYQQVGGMDAEKFPDHWAEADLSMRLRQNKQRLICQPLSNLVLQAMQEYELPKTAEEIASSLLNKTTQEGSFIERWLPDAAVDPFWNPNLSLADTFPQPETEYYAAWQVTPTALPRIVARPVDNGQGIFRISAPINALTEAGKLSACLSWQGSQRDFSPAELIRLSPDTLIVQNYMNDFCLKRLTDWHKTPGRPFTVFALDDLLTGLDESNPLRNTVPPNSRERLKFALAHSDRLVVSTQYLADAYQHLIDDIKVVPNRLEQQVWLPLHSKKRTSEKPRIGWAGGTTHQNDLLLLQEIIAQTRNEADWIFFGMCPEEIRPLLAEYHPLRPFSEYPEYLASLSLDLAVAPLDQTPFNQGKSNLRLLEYGMLGIPVVCTDIDPYQESPACCVTNTTNSWVTALRERIHDPDAREREGVAMRHWVQQHYLLENHLDDWLNAHLPG